MLINPDEINNILSISGNQVTKRGKKYFEQSRVKVCDCNIVDEKNYVLKSYVEGTYIYDVMVAKENSKLSYTCNCPASLSRTTPCKHIIATMFNMYINEDEYLLFKKEKQNIVNSSKLYHTHIQNIRDEISDNNLVKYYENLELNQRNKIENVNLIPILDLVPLSDKFNLSFEIGKEKMYKLRDLLKFYYCMIENEKYKYGKELEFIHDIRNFNPNSVNLVKFVLKRINEYAEYSKLGSYYFSVSSKYKGSLRYDPSNIYRWHYSP